MTLHTITYWDRDAGHERTLTTLDDTAACHVAYGLAVAVRATTDRPVRINTDHGSERTYVCEMGRATRWT